MTENVIGITITGHTGSGKSRIAVLLKQFMEANGFDVELKLNDGDIVDILEENLMDVIAHVAANKNIKINEVNLARTAKFNV